MSKKNQLFKKVTTLVGVIFFLNGIIAEPGHALFDWFFNFFSSAKAREVTIALHESNKSSAHTPDSLYSLGSFKKPLMLVLWAIGCQPCLQELVVLNKLAPKIRAQGGDVIPVLMGPNWGQVVAFLTHMSRRSGGSPQADRTWENVFENLQPYYDIQGEISQLFKVTLVPVVVFLDEKGRAIERHEGYKQWDTPEGLAEIEENLGITLRESAPQATPAA